MRENSPFATPSPSAAASTGEKKKVIWARGVNEGLSRDIETAQTLHIDSDSARDNRLVMRPVSALPPFTVPRLNDVG